MQVGYWGIPGTNRDFKVHIRRDSRPLCGCRFSPRSEFQWCAHADIFTVIEYVTCLNCKAAYDRLIDNARRRAGATRKSDV